ncbi:hypothetical protein COV06_01665 [Candidatus Uhrbacteria bacterium CG10_big_fil_rev_8_21_14_0_10_50_16]|uniref:Uncharacterized protein n=1 Tax=Candidatus Uhrbacteria bacterium CG10_big_fil_rev_8_21_14_0_10_50_16 TaxID=1975039 RepID=A0A2H0RNR3_9BACT|nr:MAG: hypothetical protein COV06_01665 [Candidatus Uhrbacteria bacterium CG10_big_fil_rev_8_21_14_0_10_50_16]
MDHEHDHDHEEECCSSPTTPRGASSFGWLWVVGIIVVVALILFFLQGRVPEANAPSVQDESGLTQQVPAIQDESFPPVDEMVVDPAVDEPYIEPVIE